jgi:hypothetical protein
VLGEVEHGGGASLREIATGASIARALIHHPFDKGAALFGGL